MGMEEQTCLHSKPAEKRRKKKEKKNHGINPGQHHLKYTEADSAIENAEADFSIEWKSKIITSQTDQRN